MKTEMTILICFLFLSGCKQTITGPPSGGNLLINPTFEWNGVPSLYGWTVADTLGVSFSMEIPPNGGGRTIVVHPSWLPTWPIGIAYQVIPAVAGTHTYRISVFGKKIGESGGVGVRLNRPDTLLAQGWFPGITVVDTTWTFYSRLDTITAVVGDSLFFAIITAACEVCIGSTYLNTCSFERID